MGGGQFSLRKSSGRSFGRLSTAAAMQSHLMSSGRFSWRISRNARASRRSGPGRGWLSHGLAHRNATESGRFTPWNRSSFGCKTTYDGLAALQLMCVSLSECPGDLQRERERERERERACWTGTVHVVFGGWRESNFLQPASEVRRMPLCCAEACSWRPASGPFKSNVECDQRIPAPLRLPQKPGRSFSSPGKPRKSCKTPVAWKITANAHRKWCRLPGHDSHD